MASPLALLRLPVDVLGSIRLLPEIARHTEAMARNTALLDDVLEQIGGVKSDTGSLPQVARGMGDVSEGIDGLVARMPASLEQLDDRIERLSGLMERFLGSVDELSRNVDALREAITPLGRIARRLPGQSS